MLYTVSIRMRFSEKRTTRIRNLGRLKRIGFSWSGGGFLLSFRDDTFLIQMPPTL